MALKDVIADLIHHADARMLAGWYRAVSVRSERVRHQLRSAGYTWLDHRDGRADLSELDRSAHWIIKQSRFGATTVGGIAGLGGIASVPPEVLAQFVAALRMGQRLAIVYGFDPATDRGQMALSRALAAGFEVDLPQDGPVGMRVSDLPSVVAPRVLAPRTVSGDLLGSILRKSAWVIGARITRLVPLAGAGVSASAAGDARQEIGERMQVIFRQLAEVRSVGVIEEAVEVG